MADGDETRPSAIEIYEQVIEDAHDELERSPSSLAFSGLFAGMTLGLSGLGVAAAIVTLGGTRQHHFVAALLYPLGFLAVILGRAQLFTENTLYPVVLVLEDWRRYLLRMLRLWGIVLAANLLGAIVFAFLVVDSGALSSDYRHELVGLGSSALAGSFWQNFSTAIVAGWIIALIAWLVEASDTTAGRFLVIAILSYLVGLGGFDHSVASAAEALTTVVNGHASVGHFAWWLTAVTLGNTIGGVFIVAVLNFGQVRSGEGEERASQKA